MGQRLRLARAHVASIVLAATIVVILLCLSFTRASRGEEVQHARTRAARKLAGALAEAAGLDDAPTLRFEVCNGFANQRLALVYGILLAHLLGRTAVLPSVLTNGTQVSDDWVAGDASTTVPLSKMYDAQHLLDALAQEGIVALEPLAAPRRPPLDRYTFVAMKEAPADPVQWLQEKGINASHLSIDCAFLRLPPALIQTHASTFWAILRAFIPSPHLAAYVQAGIAKLRSFDANHTSYNFLHVRLENDWLAHCHRWGSIQDGIIRANCFNNTYTLDTFLQSRGVNTETVLYVASSWGEANTELVKQVMGPLVSAGYQVVTQQYLFPAHGLSREEAACVEYHIALASQKFIGNSVSSFSALLILERQRAAAWAAYYNGGNIPMSAAVPLYKLPWVFTYNSWSAKYDYMLKAAVRSASAMGGQILIPYCLFGGDDSSPIAVWLKAQGVTVIHAEPEWTDRLIEGVKKADNLAFSHLYADPQMQIGTWQRIDIPILQELSEWEYVLFTDSDVYFRKPLTLDSFAQPLPETIGMAAEMEDVFPYNAGIMLMHMPPLRATYESFIHFIFQNQNGMYFPGYGPGDQGAFNQFYENSVIGSKLGQEFNAKPYFPTAESAYIVHFHGPKPADLLAFLETGDCLPSFAHLCDAGTKQSYCFYALEWAKHIQDEDVGQRLYAACKVLSLVSTLPDLEQAERDKLLPEDGTSLIGVLSNLE